MELNSIYDQLSSFWDKIFPVLLFHILGGYALYKIGGSRFYIREKIEKYTQSEDYQKSKSLLQEFDLWSKVPYLLIFAGILYLIVFNGISSAIGNLYPSFVKLSYSETQLWKSVYKRDLAIIEYFRIYSKENMETDSSKKNIDINQLYFYKGQNLETFKSKYPEQFRSYVKWIQDDESDAAQYYHLSTLFFILTVIALFWQMKVSPDKKIAVLLRFILILLITFIIIGAFRYKWEAKVEQRIQSEISFVSSCLLTENQTNNEKVYENIEKVEAKINDYYNTFNHNFTPWFRKLFTSK